MSWVEVSPLDAIPRRGARVMETLHGAIAVFRTAEDEVFAVEDQCPHKGGPLSLGIVHGKEVTCPLHGWKVHLDTGRAVPPDEGCARSHPTKIVDGLVYVFLGLVPALTDRGKPEPCRGAS